MPTRTTALILGFVAAACAGLWAHLMLTPRAPGLAGAVAQGLPETGVSNPVTAVLLDFRGYDTLLEVAVIALAVIGAAVLAPRQAPPAPLTGPVARAAAATLAPAIVIVAGYLLWTGGARPGGAFQAGALLAGGLVLLEITGAVPWWRQGRVGRLWVVAGTAAFLAAGLGVMAATGRFLDYPGPVWGYAIILGIEAVAALSIAVALSALFAAEPAEDGA
jgi:multisubunit Na+/H+ antiporter MnhB subunit